MKNVIIAVILGIALITSIFISHFEISKETAKVKDLKSQNAELKQEIKAKESKINDIKKEIGKVKVSYIGTFKATFYTDNEACCGKSDGITSTGTHVSDLTVAVDPDVIPMGSLIYIEGIGFRRAEDTGGAIDGKILDIYVDSYAEAVKLGVKYTKVYLIEGK